MEGPTKPHDRGGWPTDDPIDQKGHTLSDWEVRLDAICVLLNRNGLVITDASRRAQEDLDPSLYERLSYYERRAAGVADLLVERGVFTREELDRKVADLEARDKR